MMEQGLVDEVRGLADEGLAESLTSRQAIGYREILAALAGECTMEQAVEDIKRATRRYAKRQLSWFRGDERVVWIDALSGDVGSLADHVMELARRSPGESPDGGRDRLCLPRDRFPPYVPPEKAVLVGVDRGAGEWDIETSMDELERLALTDGAVTVGRLTQRLDRPVPKTFLGSGKVAELREMAEALEADVIIFDDELSPSQQANLERMLGMRYKVIDRTALILDIFGQHATTHEGKLQVQMAQLQYLYPRLRGMWSHLAKDKDARRHRVAASARERASSRWIAASSATASRRCAASSPRYPATARSSARSGGAPRCFACRWPATPTPASLRCSTGSPAPTCTCRTSSSPRSTPRRAPLSCPAGAS